MTGRIGLYCQFTRIASLLGCYIATAPQDAPDQCQQILGLASCQQQRVHPDRLVTGPWLGVKNAADAVTSSSHILPLQWSSCLPWLSSSLPRSWRPCAHKSEKLSVTSHQGFRRGRLPRRAPMRSCTSAVCLTIFAYEYEEQCTPRLHLEVASRDSSSGTQHAGQQQQRGTVTQRHLD